MKVVRPIPFLASHLISTTATETYADYVAGTTYALAAKVVYSGKVYESLQAANTGHTPDTSPTWWLDLGASNKYAMFDTKVSTQTTAPSPSLSVVFKPSQIYNSVTCLNMEAVSVDLVIKDALGGNTIHSETKSLDSSTVIDGYTYFFEPFEFADTAVFENIPPYSTSVVYLTINSDTAIKCGMVVYGNIIEIGGTQYGASAGIIDYSVKQTDEFGNTTFVQRPFSKRLETQLFIDNGALNAVNKILQGLRATPTVWIMSDDSRFSSTITYGYYKDYNIEIPYPTASLVSLTIEGLI